VTPNSHTHKKLNVGALCNCQVLCPRGASTGRTEFLGHPLLYQCMRVLGAAWGRSPGPRVQLVTVLGARQPTGSGTLRKGKDEADGS
jgi:hypothetical protein